MSDSVPIQGHFSQDGNSVSRFKLERFLLMRDSSVEFVDRSLGYKWSGHAVGALLWCLNIGLSAYQINQFLDALERKNNDLETSGRQEAFSNTLYKLTIPLTIGSEIASFVQSRLYNRSDYLLHKGLLAFNASAAEKSHAAPIDLHIEKLKNGCYQQDGLLLTEPVLYGVLREQPASRPAALWSATLHETGAELGTWGGLFIGLALLSYLQEASGDTSLLVDKKGRDANLKIGISLAASGVVSAIVSAVTRNVAVKKYNAALPVRNIPVIPARQEVPVKKTVTLPDSTGSGIIEAPARVPADSSQLKKE